VYSSVKVGFYPQEGFIEMDKDENVENRVGVEVIELDAIIKKKTAKEIKSWKGQFALDKILKHNNFLSPFIWSVITCSRAPLNNLLGLQEAFIYQRFEVSLTTLTYSPTITGGDGGFGILPLRLSGAFLAHHSYCHEPLHSHAL
jgi:hypothetical protein